MDRHEIQTEVNPTREQWLALHHAFRRYCEARPWERLANEDVLAVNYPLGHFKGYCVALGGGGVAYGLGVYPGDRSLLNYLTTMTSEDEPYGVEALERGLALSAVLGDREELGNEERKTMRDLGLRYRGRGRWPIFRSVIPGHWPRYVNGDEARFLTVALNNVRDVAERIGRGMLDLYAGRDPSEVLTRSLRGGVWRDEWEPLRPPALPVEEHLADNGPAAFDQPVDAHGLSGVGGDGVVHSHGSAGRERHKALPAHVGHGGRGRLQADLHPADAGKSSVCSGETGTGAGVAGAGGAVAGRSGMRPGGYRRPAGANDPRVGHRAVRWTHAGAGCHQG